uniref:non-specific serine/threonine protein kinase n=1 Tax=Brugia timori TaxID=42155 RepID=A0A0R3QZH9_9BILA
LYILVWKVTDGETALPDLRQWLVNIQARAPNSPVIIVGTHVDQIFSNSERFPSTYLEDLNALIRDHFVMVSDADKKGLPRVVESLFVSSKTKQNIRALCNLLYHTAYDIRTANSKERLLDQKIPASYMALEKIVVELADERRSKGIEPVMRNSDFRATVQERMLKNYGRAFRDDIEFNHACSFLHENGVILHYEDVTLRELYFLDPQWLCDILAHVITIREINPFARNGLMKIDDLQVLFKSLNLNNSAINLRSHIISLLQKFEVALCWQSRSLLIPSLLPDEYQLRGGYPGSRVLVPTRTISWQLTVKQREAKNSLIMKASHLQMQTLFSQRNLGGKRYRTTVPLTTILNSHEKSSASVSVGRNESGCDKGIPLIDEHRCTVNMEYLEQEVVRRIYMMAYIPSGFWSRLMTRVLVDDHITMCMERLLEVEYLSEDSSLETLNELCDRKFLPYWLLWQTGFEILAFEKTIFVMRQFLPLAEVRDIHYETVEWRCCAEDSNWRTLDISGSSLIEIIIPAVRINLVSDEKEYVLRSNRAAVTRLLALIVDIMDTLLEDWYPSLGTRFVHTSEGCLLVNRLVPCLKCASSTRNLDAFFKVKKNDDIICDASPKHKLHAFMVEECILSAHDGVNLRCPLHFDISVVDIAPDTVFLDINEDYLIQPNSVKRGKLIGHGAFGFVFKAALKISDANAQDVALKMLEPVEPGLGARVSSVSAYKAAYTKWQRDPLQNACRAYCTCRQELNVLASLQHSHITALMGVCPRPLALLVELAPLGALNHLLNNYRRSGARLRLSVIQDTASQVAKA